jgi:murein DD-endopeptidase MepM/ murein hydrolase activator NlpD
MLVLLLAAFGPVRGKPHTPPNKPPEQPSEPEPPTIPEKVIKYIDLSSWVDSMWYSSHSASQPGYCPFVPSPGFSGFSMWPVTGDIPPGGEFASMVGRQIRHHGVDIWPEVGEGAPIYAPASGYVVWAGGGENVRGLGVAISHGWGFSVYAHVENIFVVCGQWVNVGDLIATVGHTGLGSSNANHLHWMLLDGNGLAVDPLEFMAVN